VKIGAEFEGTHNLSSFLIKERSCEYAVPAQGATAWQQIRLVEYVVAVLTFELFFDFFFLVEHFLINYTAEIKQKYCKN
jgi:hypothetical protein